MRQEELQEGTSIFAADGNELGEISRFVLEANTNQVTHLVIRGSGPFSGEKVVPFDQVHTGEAGRLELDEGVRDYDRLPPFEASHYIEVIDLEREPRETGEYPFYARGPVYYHYPPVGYTGYPEYGLGPGGWPLPAENQTVPSGTLILQEGLLVASAKGEQVGLVKRLLVDENTRQLTHFLVSEDVSFREHRLVPVKWVRLVTEDQVLLNVSTKVLESLPVYESE